MDWPNGKLQVVMEFVRTHPMAGPGRPSTGKAGWTIPAIAQHLGVSRRLVSIARARVAGKTEIKRRTFRDIVVAWLRDVQNDECALCLGPLPEAVHVHHDVPLAAGGEDALDNMVLTCPTCNLKRGGVAPDAAAAVQPGRGV